MNQWRFDGNDWFLVISMVLLFVMILFLPKRFPAAMLVPMVLFSGLLAQTTDCALAGVLDMYDFLDSQILEPTYAVAQLVLYPEMAYLFYYFYEKWNLRKWWTVLYVLICAVLSTGYEWLSLKFDVLTYKGWKLWYSFPVYIGVFVSLVWVYHWMTRMYAKKDMPLG